MFLERLTETQIREFVMRNIKDDMPKQFSEQMLEVGNYGKKCAVSYYSKKLHKRRTLHLTDDSITHVRKKNLEDAWIRYLYSIFGREYKSWYMQKKAALFQKAEVKR